MDAEKQTRDRGRGRVFRPVKRGRVLRFWQIAYWGPKDDGTWGEIRESARTADRRIAAKLLDERLRQTGNHRRGLERFVGPRQDRVTVGEILTEMIRDCETRSI